MKFTIKGLEFKMVSEFPVEVFTKLHDIVTMNEEGQLARLRSEFEQLGSGACGTVFKIAEGYALKVNFTGFCSWDSDELQDGVILEALQGVPLVPTLYTYEQDNKYMLVQLIDGITIKDAGRGELPSLGLKEFDSAGFMRKAEDFYKEAVKRGYYPKDLHNENVMVDRSGAVWVVDVGLFYKTTSERYQGRKEVTGHIEYLSQKITGKDPREGMIKVKKSEGMTGCSMSCCMMYVPAEKPALVKLIASPAPTGCTCSACMAILEESIENPEPVQLKSNQLIAQKKLGGLAVAKEGYTVCKCSMCKRHGLKLEIRR